MSWFTHLFPPVRPVSVQIPEQVDETINDTVRLQHFVDAMKNKLTGITNTILTPTFTTCNMSPDQIKTMMRHASDKTFRISLWDRITNWWYAKDPSKVVESDPTVLTKVHSYISRYDYCINTDDSKLMIAAKNYANTINRFAEIQKLCVPDSEQKHLTFNDSISYRVNDLTNNIDVMYSREFFVNGKKIDHKNQPNSKALLTLPQ